MKTHALLDHAIFAPDVRRWAGDRLFRAVRDRWLLLPIGAVIALLWANTAPESYFRFAHAAAFTVNEIGMAIFLALVVQEVFEAVMPGGALYTWRRWGLPVVAAAGGVAGAAGAYLVYVSLRHQSILFQAWPAACAVDLAAAYYVLKIVWRRSTALPFLLLLTLATDGFGLVLVALRPHGLMVRPGGALLMLAALGLAAVMRWKQVRGIGYYIAFCGTLSWWALYWEGVHPALALIPIVPFLPRKPRPLDLLADLDEDDLLRREEHGWNGVAQTVLFFFGLVNAGVVLRGYDTGTWAMLAAALVGRPIGILAAVGLAVAAGFRLPRRLGWREAIVVAFATSSGFTFALFFATGIIPMGPVLTEIKLGALGTVAAAPVALAAARLLRVGRFAR